MKIFKLEQIQESINITKDLEDLINSQKAAFIDYSSGLYKIQAAKFGDVARALKEGIISQDALMELGAVLKPGVSENTKTIIADFSGIGAQDVAIAKFILSRLVPN